MRRANSNTTRSALDRSIRSPRSRAASTSARSASARTLRARADAIGSGALAAATRLWLSLMLDRRANGTAAVVAADVLASRIARAFELASLAPQGPDMFGQPPPTIRNVLATLHAEQQVDLPYLPDAIRDYATPQQPPPAVADATPGPAPVRGAADAPVWTPDQVDADGRPIWPEAVRAGQAAHRQARARLAAALGRPDGPDIGTHLIDTPQRVDLRKRILAEVLADRVAFVGTVRQERQAFIVMGPPAAGKSTVIEPLARRHGALIVDADDIKAKLPEFDGGRGAGLVHQESANLANDLRDASIARGDNIALPIVGASKERVAGEIAALRAAGYRVTLILADLPIEKAVDRAIKRFMTTGRLVDPDYVWSIGNRPRENYMSFRRLADESAFYSTDVPPGQRPRRIGGARDPLADVQLDGRPGRGARDAVDQGRQALAGGASQQDSSSRPGTAAGRGGDPAVGRGADATDAAAQRGPADPDLAVLSDAVDELARAGKLDEADLATLRQGNDAGDTAAAMADARETAAACMVRAA